MDWMSSFVIIIIILCNLHQVLNFTDPDNERFRCSTGDTDVEADRIRLYLHSQYLNITCSLYFVNQANDELLNIHVPLYTSVGMIPSLEIFNRSSKYVFNFERTLTQDMSAWHLSIPREKLVIDTDVFPVDEWYVKVKLYYGTLWESVDGTLLDVMREPILQWKLGKEVHPSEIIPILNTAYSLKVVKRLCANDVSILAPLFNNEGRHDAGIYLFVTKSAFTSVNDKWYDIKPAICSLIQGVCNVKLLDIILTNRHLVIFTNLGLFMSEDMLFQPGKDLQRGRQLTFFRNFAIAEDEIYRILLWHTEECFAQKIDVMEYLSITADVPHGNIKSCRFSLTPFKTWNLCFPPQSPIAGIVATAWDNQQNTIITLSFQIKVAITVWKCDKDFNIIGMKAFQQFYFPDLEFFPTGLFVYPTMYYLYAYGSQVWYSMDGGNSFNLLIKLKVGHVIKAFACPRFNAVIFITNNNIIYYTRPGMARYALFDNWEKEKLAFSCDHYGALMKISVDISGVTGLKVQFIDHQSLIAADDAGFLRPLALQYLTSVKVIVFEHASWIEDPQGVQPMFSPTHVGKLLKLSLGGSVEITHVYEHSGVEHFLAAVVGKIMVPYHAEPFHRRVLTNKLLVVKRGGLYHLELLDAEYGFIADDFEKTVVIPGLSSFLIVRINSSNLVIAHATMPELVSDYLLIEEKKWFIYDFSSKSGVWAIVENECTTQIEDLDNIQLNSEMFLDINDTVKLRFKSSSFKGGNAQRFKVSIGNPHLLRIETENYWDDSGIASLNLVIYSNFNVRGYTTVSISISEASLLCPVVSIPIILYCSCPAGKMILYKEPISISRDEWLYGNPKDDETDSPLLKTLPVNYRPPSPQGINVPLSENIYNADPSKPRFRDFYKISKETGIYKQCVAKKSREECGCTEEMMLSSFAEFSDCKQRVYRVSYPGHDLELSLFLRNLKEKDRKLTSPFFIILKEINQRTDWGAISTLLNPSFSKIKYFYKNVYIMHNPDKMAVNLFGSELYHFRVTIIPGVSLCELVTELQIYVDDPPMPYPFHYLVSMVTAIILGAMIMIYFFLQRIHCIHTNKCHCWKLLKINLLSHKRLFKGK